MIGEPVLSTVHDLRSMGRVIYPSDDQIFHALELTPPEETRVVILGQDPYANDGQAMGLSFSVPDGVPPPPSLRNILKEVAVDIHGDGELIGSPNLTRWARQGVLLLNCVLTVERGNRNSHANIGWEVITNRILLDLNDRFEHLVFMLWGEEARKRKLFINSGRHLVLETSHPSPLSAYRGFLGCRHFSKANKYLRRHGHREIEW